MHQYQYERVIFICTDNTIVSPMAETIFKAIPLVKGIECYSRGIVVLFQEPVNPKAVDVAKNHGIEMINSLSTQFHRIEANEHTLLLTMTKHQKEEVINHFEIKDNIYTLKEFIGEDGDCIDPYGQSLLAYEECFEELTTLVKKVAYRIASKTDLA